jgi:hypothetical protein
MHRLIEEKGLARLEALRFEQHRSFHVAVAAADGGCCQ